MNKQTRYILAGVLAVYILSVGVAIFFFTAERAPSQLSGWIGGAAFVLIIVLLYKDRFERKLRKKIEQEGLSD